MPLIRWRKRPWLPLALTTLMALLAALIYLQRATPIYLSTARIRVERPNIPGPRFPTRDFFLTQAQIITGPPMLERVRRDPNMLTLTGSPDPNYLNDLAATLTATVEKDSDILKVSAAAPHPQDAAEFVNAVVRAYIQWHEDQWQSSQADWLKMLTDELEECRGQLTVMDQELRQFLAHCPELLSEQPAEIDEALERLKRQCSEAHAAVAEVRGHYQVLQHFTEDPRRFRPYARTLFPSELPRDDHRRTPLAEQLNQTQAKIDALQADPNVPHSRIAPLEKTKAELKQGIEELDTAFVSSARFLAKTRLEKAQDHEAKFIQQYSQAQEYHVRLSPRNRLQEMCDALEERIKQWQTSPPLPRREIHILENATTATRPYKPNKTKVMGLTAVAGLLPGALFAALTHLRRTAQDNKRTATLSADQP